MQTGPHHCTKLHSGGTALFLSCCWQQRQSQPQLEMREADFSSTVQQQKTIRRWCDSCLWQPRPKQWRWMQAATHHCTWPHVLGSKLHVCCCW
jgi:hypothetical protein